MLKHLILILAITSTLTDELNLLRHVFPSISIDLNIKYGEANYIKLTKFNEFSMCPRGSFGEDSVFCFKLHYEAKINQMTRSGSITIDVLLFKTRVAMVEASINTVDPLFIFTSARSPIHMI
jgi:hypothetical protein